MKRFVKSIVFGLFVFFTISSIVKAETFYEGEYISGEYINKVIDGKTYYMTMQFIKDSNGNIVYCLEPFVKFVDGKIYEEYSNLDEYNSLSKEQKRRISLIIYYGYGYGNRTSNKWYVITQYLVWKEVDPKANVYFTNKLNGNKIDKYLNEIEFLLNDVNNHDIKPSFIKKYEVNYNDGLIIEGLNSNYEIVNCDYAYSYNSSGNMVIPSLKDDTVISFRKLSNIYKNKVTIYDSSNSQDVIRPGNVVNDILELDIHVNKGDITLDIRNDNSVYTIESDFTDTCYEISNDKEVLTKVCTGDDSLIYKTDYLPYGDYYIKQVSTGIGYVFDTNIYKVSIDKLNTNPEVILYNKLLRNDIEILKYACVDDECVFEKDAIFDIYDSNNNLVDSIITNDEGYGVITLGYGSYVVKQSKGLDGYTLSDEYVERIVDESSIHFNELINNYIEKEGEVLGEYVKIPDTKVDSDLFLFDFFTIVIQLFKDIFAIFE